MKTLIDRLSDWFNSRSDRTQVICFLGFCLFFITALWLSINYIKFDAQVYQNMVPAHIGKPSGIIPDSITLNK